MVRKSVKRAADKSEMTKWLFDNSHDLMHVAGSDGRFRLVNRAWCLLTGIAEAELIGRSCLDFYHPDDVLAVRERARQGRPGDYSDSEIRVRALDGDWRWFATRRQIMADGSHVVTMRDAHAEHMVREEVAEARRTRKPWALLQVSASGSMTQSRRRSGGQMSWSSLSGSIRTLSGPLIAFTN